MIALEVWGDWPAEVNMDPVNRAVQAVNAAGMDWLSTSGRINLKLVDDETIRALNKQYSGNDYATDVLSFSYIEDTSGEADGELGDVAVSIETAQRQADQAGISVGDELAALVLHGILHIYGLDHATAEEQAIMDEIQSQVLEAAGITYRKFNWT